MKRILQLLYIGLTFVCFAFNANGQQANSSMEFLVDSNEFQKDYFKLSLEEILDIKVVTASKKEVKVSQEPDIITTVSQQEIELFGANTLLDILERVVSVYLPYSFVFPNQNVSLRGDYPNHLNPHVLYLINGRPFRELTMGGQNGSLLNGFPVASIQKIEILRGPGSVLYGTNAFTGVINIITKEAKKELEGTAYLKGGSFRHKEAMAQLQGKSKNVSWSSTSQINKDNGWGFSDSLYSTSQGLKAMEVNMFKENFSTMNKVKFNDFTGQFYYGTTKSNSITSGVLEERVFHDNRLLADVGFEKKKGKLLNLNVNVTCNVMDNKITDDSVTYFTFEGEDFLFEAYNYFYLPKNLNLVVGANVNRTENKRLSSGKPIIPFEDFWWFSGYGQVEYSLQQKITFNIGFQANKIHNVDLDIVPRIAGAYFITNKIGVKSNYGKAFRSPTISESASENKPFVLGNSELVPEKVTSFNGQFFYYTKTVEYQITYFNNVQENLITREKLSDDSGYWNRYINGDKHKFEGIELESKINLNKTWLLTGNLSHQQNVWYSEEENVENATLVPNTMFKMALGYIYKRGVNIGVSNTFVGNAYEVDGSYQVNDAPAFYNLLSANVKVQLHEYFYLKNKLEVQLYAYNILDEKIVTPDFSNSGGVNGVQSRPRQSFFVSLIAGF